MHGSRIPFFAAIASAGALLLGSVSSLLVGAWPDVSLGHIVEVSLAVVASGFLFFVRKWIARQEEADRKVMDTIREATEHQLAFESRVTEFMGMVKGHLGLHREESDPSLLISDGSERRTRAQRRIVTDRREGGR